MSNSLVQIFDRVILPATLLVVGKVVGLYLTTIIFSLPWRLKELPTSILSVSPAFLQEDIIIASSYSDLIMFSIIAIGFSVVLVQATYFHESHINPRLLIKLNNTNLFGIVKSSFDIYHSAAVWGVFLWIANIITWINFFAGKNYLWITLLTTFTALILTSILLNDVNKEIQLSKNKIGSLQALA